LEKILHLSIKNFTVVAHLLEGINGEEKKKNCSPKGSHFSSLRIRNPMLG